MIVLGVYCILYCIDIYCIYHEELTRRGSLAGEGNCEWHNEGWRWSRPSCTTHSVQISRRRELLKDHHRHCQRHDYNHQWHQSPPQHQHPAPHQHRFRCCRTRAEKSKSLIWWKRRKGRKRREKAEKADLVMQLAFWQKLCQKEQKQHLLCKRRIK